MSLAPPTVVKTVLKYRQWKKLPQATFITQSLAWKLNIATVAFMLATIAMDSMLIYVGMLTENQPCERDLAVFLIGQGSTSLSCLVFYWLARYYNRSEMASSMFWAMRFCSFIIMSVGASWVYNTDSSQCNSVVYDWSLYYIISCVTFIMVQAAVLTTLFFTELVSSASALFRLRRKKPSNRGKKTDYKGDEEFMTPLFKVVDIEIGSPGEEVDEDYPQITNNNSENNNSDDAYEFQL